MSASEPPHSVPVAGATAPDGDRTGPPGVLAPVRPTFRALAETIVPAASALEEAGWRELERIVSDALVGRPLAMRRQMGILIRALGWLPVLRWGRRFRKLDGRRRRRFLAAVQDAPLTLLRRGFWGLRTLVYMGYYARPAAAREVGYRPWLRGWRREDPVFPGESP